MINPDYIKNYLVENKIIFSTNVHDNNQSGFQNYGPIGLKIKNKIINGWRKNFVNPDNKINIYEIESPVISNSTVLSRSGHIQKFNDYGIVFKNLVSHQTIRVKRADHFIEDKINELNLPNVKYIEDVEFITNFVKSNNLYDTESEYFEVKPISLMFKLDSEVESLYLRPEIAQTIFIEFKEFYNYNNMKLPFGIAQVGKSYRNEISDKAFVRLREFTQAEVEHFYNPNEPFEFAIPDSHKDKECWVLSSALQLASSDQIQITLSELSNYISNPILLMYAFKLYLFSEQIGLDIDKLRFRQHKSDEMAHYAKDCWDLESNIFGKWLEITGIADRGDYDLATHDKNGAFKIKKSNTPITKYKLVPKAKEIFKQFDKIKALEIMALNKEMILDTKEQLELIDLTWYDVIEFKDWELIYPHVIEPSIGIDRVFYTLICHNLHLRPDGSRPYLLLTKDTRPYDFALLQLSNNPDLICKFNSYLERLSKYNIFTDLSSTSIGKRYTRADELGIGYSVTIDFDTLLDDTVTIRNILDMSQVRIHIDSLGDYLTN